MCTHHAVATQLDCSTTTRWKLNEAATDRRCPNSLSYASTSAFFWLIIKLRRHIFHRTEYRQSDVRETARCKSSGMGTIYFIFSTIKNAFWFSFYPLPMCSLRRNLGRRNASLVFGDEVCFLPFKVVGLK